MLNLALILQAVIWLFLAIYFLRRNDATLYHPLTLYLIFHGVVFVFRPILVHTLNFESMWFYMDYYPTEAEFVRTLLVSSAGLVAFYVSALSGKQDSIAIITGRKVEIRKSQTNALLIVWLLLGPAAWYSLIFTIDGVEFAENINVEMEIIGGVPIFVNTTGYIVYAKNMLLPLVVLTAYVGRYRWWSLLPLVLYIGYRAFIGWDRWTMVIAVMSIFFLYLWENNRKWPGKWMLGISIVLYGLFATLGENRDIVRVWATTGELEVPSAEIDTWYEKLDGSDFANFDYLAYVIRTVPELTHTYTYGTQYLQLFTEPVPRILWEDKPVGAPLKLLDLNDYGNFEYRTTALVGDGWLSGGWVGMILTMVIVGFSSGKFYAWYCKSLWSDNRSVLYLICVPTLVILYRDGGISILKMLLFILIPLLLWLVTIRFIEGAANTGYKMEGRSSL